MRLSLISVSLAVGLALSGCAGMQSVPSPGLGLGTLQTIKFDASKYQAAVMKTKPLAYFPFNTAKGGSVGGKYKVKRYSGAKIVKGGPITSDGKKNFYLSLSNQAYASTSLSGGIPGTGTMIAWVNLSELPSEAGEYFYISGESEDGNDFDLQFETDNNLYFYTGAGENTEYGTSGSGNLVGSWHMIAATYAGGTSGFRNIYWDGALVAPYNGAVDGTSKTNPFSVGESVYWTGRYFQGGIDAVAVWDHALTAKQVMAIYKAAQ